MASQYLIIEEVAPNSGGYPERITICECNDLSRAERVKSALLALPQESKSKFVILEKGVKSETAIICIDPDQTQIAWKTQQALREMGAKAIICFSMKDFSLIHEAYSNFCEPCMVVLTGDQSRWSGLDWDLGIGEFDEDSASMIWDLLE